ncbi:class I SAM-dependent methyltransferase [Myceligenerans pegani]|uniref:Class I SAM-dependent methyltransferase n=1 Tax=Myceligenerans pegani TaxID=2776917 RepID=A0ABR9N1Y0_9MICO|nr:class I SAM-dependent methyltransferase [Myceligenerans sp. TRM 65318]MBE1877663.1 class I SAM-dependent methyltransferase [Myceligenerans sp. TRM 65318]MBE3019934.1 class I SAM-dependent methyltransferase [Myceligenerans sp. TRM 65318]
MDEDGTTDPREALAERLIEDVTRSLETLSVHLGLELGLYRALADLGAITPGKLSDTANIDRRYAREWLEQQAAAGYIACEDPTAPAEERRYLLPEGHAEVLLDGDSLFHAAPGVIMFGGVVDVMRRLPRAYRTGEGVPYSEYGEDIRRGIAAFNRPQYLHELPNWLRSVPDLDGRLRAAERPRLLDLGCGIGQSTLALARAYPGASVLGVDLDEDSAAEARQAAAAARLDDRVHFTVADAASLATDGPFDLITMFETLHDMGDPVGALRTARSLLAAGGEVLVADERVADEFTAPADLVERFQFGWSVTHCLPATLAEDPVEANGTILRGPTVARWADTAGFGSFEVAPIENDFWRFYRMSD